MIGREIDKVRDEVIGLKITGFEEMGRSIHFEDEEGRNYSIDFTGEGGAIVYKGKTIDEEIEDKLMVLDLLLQKLEIDETELWELYVKEL